MKKILFLLCFCSSLSCFAQRTLSSKALAFRTNVEYFLKEEGYMPSIDEDGDIQFKREGDKYWIMIKGSDPTYLEIAKEGFSIDGANTDLIYKACNYANQNTKGAKACLGKESILLTMELFCQTVDEFKYIFYSSIRSLSALREMVKEYYSKYEE